jgi:hypothetical protein
VAVHPLDVFLFLAKTPDIYPDVRAADGEDGDAKEDEEQERIVALLRAEADQLPDRGRPGGLVVPIIRPLNTT